jgi:hypothetical protein
MATFEGRRVSDTYKNILNIDNSNSGVDGTLRTVQDGEGTSSAIKLSTTSMYTPSLSDSNNNLITSFTPTTSAVAYLTIGNAIDGAAAGVVLQVTSSGTNGNITIKGKGNDRVLLGTSTSQGLVLSGNQSIQSSGNTDFISFTKTTGVGISSFNIAQGISGTGPTIGVAGGSSSNVEMRFQALGTQSYNFLGTTTAPAVIKLFEQTTNGTNSVALAAPASLASDTVITVPNVTTTLIGADTVDTLTNKTLTAPAINGATITSPKVNQLLDSNSNEVIILGSSASAVNEVTITNAATTAAPSIGASGNDTNISLSLSSKGISPIYLNSRSTTNPLGIYSGTSLQHLTNFNVANTANTRNITLPDCDIPNFIIQRQSVGVVSQSISTSIPQDNTIPQISEGTALTNSITITPKSASNILVIRVTGTAQNSNISTSVFALFQDSTANALKATVVTVPIAGASSTWVLEHVMPAGTTSATTFSIRAGTNTGSLNVNANTGFSLGAVLDSASYLQVQEYAV